MQKRKCNEIEYHESKGDDKKLKDRLKTNRNCSIDEKDVSKLIEDIKKKEDTGALYSAGNQFAVLCYVRRGKGISYKTLTKEGLCNWSRPDQENRNNHAEQILLQNSFQVLRKYYNASKYKALQYYILLYTYNSPCKDCADMIVNTVSEARDAFEIHVVYHQPYIWGNRKPPDPGGVIVLQQTTNVFNNYNRDKDTAGPFIFLMQYASD